MYVSGLDTNGAKIFIPKGHREKTLQAALLRVIQEKEIRRLGESRRRKVDVRFVFATNRDLSDLVRKGRFRKDLYYRIAGMRLYIPPLRARKEDVLPLASHFLASCAGQRGRRAPRFSPDAVHRLIRYHWPGNVRELKNEVERLVALQSGETIITARMLSPHIDEPRDGEALACGEMGGSLPGAVRRLERAMLGETLRRFAGNRTRAARELGITRQGLLKKLKRHGMLA